MSKRHLVALEEVLARRGWHVVAVHPGDNYRVSASWEIKRNAGETILAKAEELGCDLVVKGAYTQSRLRQMIFGGTTRHILANAKLPVLMAH